MENSERDGNTRPPDFSWETCIAGQEAAELDMEQQTGSKLGKEYVKAIYCHPVNLHVECIMQNPGLDEA